MQQLSRIVPVALLGALAVSACDSKSEEAPKEAAAVSADADKAEPEAAETDVEAEPEGPQADPELLAAVDAVIANCTVDAKGGSLTACAAEEHKKLRAAVKDKQMESLPTFAVLLGDEDPNKVFVAATLLMEEYRSLGDDPEVDPVVAKALVEGFAKTDGYTAARAAPSVSMAATASGDDAVVEAMFAAANANDNDNAKTAAYRYALRYGGLAALPKVQQAAKSDEPRLVAAAVQSYREVNSPGSELKEAVCPWAEGYLTNDDDYVRQQAGWVAIKCGGTHIDKLLEVGESRLEAHEFNNGDYLVYRDICFSFMGEDTAGTEEQCERNYAYLQKAADDGEVASSDRGLALFAIYYQRRDDETKKLAGKYKNHKDPELKKRANEILESLSK